MVRNNRFYTSAAAGFALLALVACGGSQPAATAPAAATEAPAVEATTAPAADAPAPEEAATVDTATEAAAVEELATAAPAVEEAAPIEATAGAKLNLNTTEGDAFLSVPGVGQRMVREFLEYRPYRSIEQFRREIGKYVDAAQVAEYEKYVFVPVAPNDADAATLQQLPGVDQAVAEQLIAARPYGSPADFLTRLGEMVTAEQLAAAAGMVEGQ